MKMAHRLILACCLLIVHPVWASFSNRADSLRNLIIRQGVVDTKYVQLLSTLSYETWVQQPQISKEYAFKAIAVADSLQDSLGMAYANLAMGLVKWGQDNYDEALSTFIEAEKLAGRVGDSSDMILFKFYIAVAYRVKEINDLARQNFKLSLAFYRKSDDIYMHARALEEFGISCVLNTRYAEGHELLDSAMHYWKQMGNQYELTHCYLYKGIAYLSEERIREGESLIKSALANYRNYNDARGIVIALKQIGRAYIVVNRLDSAESHLLRALDIAIKNSYLAEESEIYFNLHEIAIVNKDYKLALDYFKKHYDSYDKEVSRQISYEVHDMKMKYDREADEQKIQLLNQEKEIQNTYIISLSLLIIIVSMSGMIIVFSVRNSRKKDAMLNSSMQALMQAEISNSRLKEKELTIELEKRGMELTSYTMNFIQKGTLLTELQEKFAEMEKSADTKQLAELRELGAIIKRHISSDKDWEEFKSHFDNVHPSFVNALRSVNPNLTGTEIRLAALLKMNLNSKQIADVMGISPDSVKTSRYRLRNKLGLGRSQNLTQYLNHLEASELVKGT